MENFKLVIILFPGVISIAVINFLIKRISIKDDLIGIVFFAGLNYLIMQILINLKVIKEYSYSLTIIIAIFIAFLAIYLISIEKIKNLIIKTRGGIFLTAWDTAWRRMSLEDSIIICEIKLKNNEIIRGYYTKGSSASFSYNKDGVFLVKAIENSKELTKLSNGIWIPHNEIMYIKFYNGGNIK